AKRSGSTEADMLTAGLATNATEIVTIYDALKTLAVCGPDNVHIIPFAKELHGQGSSMSLLLFTVFEFNDPPVGSRTGFLKVSGKRRSGLLFFLLVVGKLDR